VSTRPWRKEGLIFAPPRGLGWMASHAALPSGLWMGDRYRVYFSGRDEAGRGHIGHFEMDPAAPRETRALSREAVLGPGPLGAFDDSGATSSCSIRHGGRIYHYYTGWSLGGTVPFHLAIGLAVSDDEGLSFRRVSPAPILGRTETDPYLTASPCVLVEDGVWRMWYVSGTGWTREEGRPKHYYHVRYAESSDGILWTSRGVVCIDYLHAGEHAIARPWVLRDGGRYRMWYSYRGPAYRIGYAESPDGLTWQRKDAEAGIDVSAEGWDSEMIEYPCVFEGGGRLFMLYNGNGYGRTGIGLATLAD
jgi:hypothetical protein